jgi:hypothetical protein
MAGTSKPPSQGTLVLVTLFVLVIVSCSGLALVTQDSTGLQWIAAAAFGAAIAGLIWYIVRYNKAIKRREAERVAAISAHQADWGEEICKILIAGKHQLEGRVNDIMSHLDEWGQDTCKDLLQRNIGIGMSVDMVRLSLGEPTTIDNRDVSAKGEKYRYIYGVPRHGAAYIWFKDGEVTRIKQ